LLFVASMWRRTILAVLLAAPAACVDSESAALSTDESAIVGGDIAPAGKWPDTVAVLGATGSCSGTLIAPDLVLTAGHCAGIVPTTVVANTTDYAQPGGVRVGVATTIAHPKWESTYDVALVALVEPITAVAPRALGTSCTFGDVAADTMVSIVGFGVTTLDGTGRNTQLKEALTAVVDPMCAAGDGCNTAVAPGGEFVAGGTGTADSCFGDSGGPVYLDTTRGTMLIGSVSRGVYGSATPCGGGGIYVRTDKIVKWIEETTGQDLATDSCDGERQKLRSNDGVLDDPGNSGGCAASRSNSGTVALVIGAVGMAARRRRSRVRSG
jgi:secreted trypsin-like serine protease